MAKTISAGKYARRRLKYHTDPVHRAQVQRWARESMRRKRGTKAKDCRENLPMLHDLGSRRVCTIADEPHIRMSFTITETAEALMVSANRLRIWIKTGLVPGPVVDADLGNGQRVVVYVLEEVRAMMQVIGEHRAHMTHYMARHTETTARVQAKLKRVRINTGVIDG
jgi:hypothetical protein